MNDIFDNFTLIPRSPSETLDCVVRVLFIVLIVGLFFNLPFAFYVVTSGLILAIVLYKKLCVKRAMEGFRGNTVEHFDYLYGQKPAQPVSEPLKRATTDANGNLLMRAVWNPFDSEAPMQEDSPYPTNNAKLFGQPMERTLIKPIITPKSHDMDFWRATNFTSHSHINTASPDELYQSGYLPNAPCSFGQCLQNAPLINGESIQPSVEAFTPLHAVDNTFAREAFCSGSTCNRFVPPATTEEPNSQKVTQMYNVGLLNDACGYDTNNATYNLPVNLSLGECNKQPQMAQFNKNLFTSYNGPDATFYTAVNEPINANIGTAFQQQFEPVDVKNINNRLAFNQQNPLEPNIQNNIMSFKNPPCEPLSAANMTDPRLTSYGTSYRAYTDPLLGQTKYYYDDVDSVLMPSYITHNKLDVFGFGETSGPMGSQFGVSLASVRNQAEAAALDLELQRRNELQERLMQKINTESWQQRMYPISTNNYSSRGI